MVNSKIRIFRLYNNGGSQGVIVCNLADGRLIPEKMGDNFYVRRVMDFMTRHEKRGCC